MRHDACTCIRIGSCFQTSVDERINTGSFEEAPIYYLFRQVSHPIAGCACREMRTTTRVSAYTAAWCIRRARRQWRQVFTELYYHVQGFCTHRLCRPNREFPCRESALRVWIYTRIRTTSNIVLADFVYAKKEMTQRRDVQFHACTLLLYVLVSIYSMCTLYKTYTQMHVQLHLCDGVVRLGELFADACIFVQLLPTVYTHRRATEADSRIEWDKLWIRI